MTIKPTGLIVGPFSHLLQLEKIAFDLYSSYVSQLADEELKELFAKIALQEKGHMEIANELIKLVQ